MAEIFPLLPLHAPQAEVMKKWVDSTSAFVLNLDCTNAGSNVYYQTTRLKLHSLLRFNSFEIMHDHCLRWHDTPTMEKYENVTSFNKKIILRNYN